MGLASFVFLPLFFSYFLVEYGGRLLDLGWGTLFLLLLLIPIPYLAFCYFWAGLSYRFWQYELTENALRIEKGVIFKKYISIPYERIQNVDIYRGILARLLGLSDLQVQTAGYSGYGKHGMMTEGRLPGLDTKVAEELRDKLVGKIKGTKQGL
jgi:membrane protein YdbS with pleckstrin-like domain